MKLTRHYILPLSLMLSIPVLTLFYRALNNPVRGVYSMVTSLDQGIPFIKIFILPYLGFYPYIFLALAYFCFKDRPTYYKTLAAINISYLFCFTVYYFFQTTVPRPYLDDRGVLSALVANVYKMDHPYNTFPSIHVLTSFIMIKAVNKSSVRNRLNTFLIYGMSLLVIVSTQFVKQHVLLDAVSAMAAGNLLFEGVYYLTETDLFLRARNVMALAAQRVSE